MKIVCMFMPLLTIYNTFSSQNNIISKTYTSHFFVVFINKTFTTTFQAPKVTLALSSDYHDQLTISTNISQLLASVTNNHVKMFGKFASKMPP